MIYEIPIPNGICAVNSRAWNVMGLHYSKVVFMAYFLFETDELEEGSYTMAMIEFN